MINNKFTKTHADNKNRVRSLAFIFKALLIIITFFAITLPQDQARAAGIFDGTMEMVKGFVSGNTTNVLNKIDAIPDAGGGMPTFDIRAWLRDLKNDILKKIGVSAYNFSIRTALNKIAYDTATWLGSGGEGQKPLFVTEDWGKYLARIGDEAAGDFLEQAIVLLRSGDGNANRDVMKIGSLLKKYSTPSSLNALVSISLGLQDRGRDPGLGAGKISDIVASWKGPYDKFAHYTSDHFLADLADSMHPAAGDIGIYSELLTDILEHESKALQTTNLKLQTFKGYLDPKTIAGDTIGLPGQAEADKKLAEGLIGQSMLIYTGDALADAASVFTNQLALTSFNRLMRNLGTKISSMPSSYSLDFFADPNYSGGRAQVQSIVRKSLSTNFKAVENYDVLSELRYCPSTSNLGASDCVINDGFMQAIIAKKTVAEAVAEGYLNGNWLFEIRGDASSYEKNFSWRNVSILRKYRIVPASWELVFEKLQQLEWGELEKISNVKKKQATLRDLISCFSPYDEYNDFSNSFDATDQAWCTGLVDPNWVLKAPASYCAREGYGSQIVESSNSVVVRVDGYCADYQTCILENKDGGCDAYGYCNEEKRIWRFDAETCQPVNNTCQSFVNPNTRREVAFLENTLDYSICNADNAGCKQYTNSGTYNQSTSQVDWSSGDPLFLNNKTETCSSQAEGCEEIIRVKSAWGANLVMNSNFRNDEIGDTSTGPYLNEWTLGPQNSQATIIDVYEALGQGNGRAIKLEGNPALLFSDGSDSPRPNAALPNQGAGGGGINTQAVGGDVLEILESTVPLKGNSLLPNNFSLIPGRIYTVSADVYLESGSRVVIALGTGSERSTRESTATGIWHHISVSKQAGVGFNDPSFSIAAYDNAIIYVKNIKFEISPWDTGYSSYANTKTYQKLLPNYLKNACYIGDSGSGVYSYQLKPGAPAECRNYTRQCSASDVGCELYSLQQSKFAIPAKVSDLDYCPGECVGYDMYINRETNFFSTQLENIIPSTAQTCNADAVGCSEFTNLDELASGGENKEYYSQLKQCIKPSQASCREFYYWEGTESGYQLQMISLKTALGGPDTVADDSGLCNADIFNTPINSPDYNPDCRQYYNSAGDIFYHLASYTITCSDECRSYRLTEKNLDFSISQDNCSGRDKHWDNQEGACVYCKNGGQWDANHQACIYQAIPNEGKTCQASQSSCREYSGSAGNNIRLVSAHDFENNYQGWTSNCKNGIEISEIANEQGGHSLYYRNNASQCSSIGVPSGEKSISQTPLVKRILAGDNQAMQLSVGASVMRNKSYNIQFWAKSLGAQIKIYFLNPQTGESSAFNGGQPIYASGDGWQMYSVNLEAIDHEVSYDEKLILTANQDFYLDNFILTEITDRYYLIKSTSQIPNVCYYDILDNYQGADYNLGCSAYSDRAGSNHNLHSFSSLCSTDVVGCEQVIKTNNYSPYQTGIWNDLNGNGRCDVDELDCVMVPEDQTDYIIYDSKKVCNSADKGCERLGEALAGTNASIWSDVFKKNNPDNYKSILCEKEAVSCEAWPLSGGGGYSYFRDPGQSYCVYRSPRTGGEKGWYQAPAKRCDLNKNGVIDGNEIYGSLCATDSQCGGSSCISDSNDYPCDVSYNLTIGNGGEGKQVPVPINQAGVCDAKESTCREYIDPVSNFNPNLLTVNESDYSNRIYLKPNRLYALIYVDKDTSQSVSLEFAHGVTVLDIDNNFLEHSLQVTSTAGDPYIIFNSKGNDRVNRIIGKSSSIVLRELAIEYILSSSLEHGDCNGLVNPANGCVLFNERSYDGGNGYSSLEAGFDPLKTSINKSALQCNPNQAGSCLSNTLIKVRPDRVCAAWLDCDTYAYDENNKKVCYSLRPCNSLDDKGECNNFISQNYTPSPENATGYYIPGQYSIGSMKEFGLNSSAHFDFEELVPSISCVHANDDGSSRLAKDGKPDLCQFGVSTVEHLIVRSNEVSGVDYPISGRSYIKIPGKNLKISPQPIGSYFSLSPGQDYYLSYYLNTKNTSSEINVILETPLAGSEEQGRHMASFKASSHNGWEKQIHHFRTGTNEAGGDVKARVSFYVKNANEIAYIDDINIEPILELSENNYASRECRLYPGMSSYACIDQRGSVTNQGLEGYCLERDRLNPYVCSTWYPVDRISSSLLHSSNVGYSGPVELSYCTNIDANFGFAKKIVAKLVASNLDKTSGGEKGLIGIDQEIPAIVSNTDLCIRGGVGGNYWSDSGRVKDMCGDADLYELVAINDKRNWNHEFIYCVPKASSPYFLFSEDYLVNIKNLTNLDLDNPNSCDFSVYPSAWVDIRKGLFQQKGEASCKETMDLSFDGSFTAMAQINDCGPINETTNATPPVRIYDKKNKPYNIEGLKYISSGFDQGAQRNVYQFACTEFDQRVAGDGSNQAWVVRTGANADKEYNLNTPPFFANNISSLKIEKYGRLTVNPPYGAATLPLNYNFLTSGPIYLKDQYHQMYPSSTYAGRPYGCTGVSCENVGYCSGNPDVFCTYFPTTTANHYINVRSCSDGGFGVCQPLWEAKGQSSIGDSIRFDSVLDQIFRKSYGKFTYQDGGYEPSPAAANFNLNPGNDPVINNVELRYLNSQTVVLNMRLNRSGIYELRFNIDVDDEQLPLKMIYIDWGDGNKQAFTGLDSKSNPNNPHVFYHYYVNRKNNPIIIRAWDNWEVASGYWEQAGDYTWDPSAPTIY